MASGPQAELADLIVRILAGSAAPLSIPQIERKLADQVEADTFDVRDAVWELIAEKRAAFTPRRHVQLAGKAQTPGD